MHMLPKIHVKTRGHLSFSTAGPQTTSLHLTSFHRNIDEKKKSQFWVRVTVYVQFAHSSHVSMGFLRVCQFLPISQRCAC